MRLLYDTWPLWLGVLAAVILRAADGPCWELPLALALAAATACTMGSAIIRDNADTFCPHCGRTRLPQKPQKEGGRT